MITALSLIVAIDAQSGIGKNNDLMWNLPADMQFFKQQTNGHVVIMGRKNYDSISRKIPASSWSHQYCLEPTIRF